MMTFSLHTLRRIWTATLLTPLLAIAGCGYHAVGAASHIPGGVTTIDVPIFSTRVLNYNTETDFTRPSISERNTRTAYPILNGEKDAADAHLTGTILTQTISPLTYDSTSGQTAT